LSSYEAKQAKNFPGGGPGGCTFRRSPVPGKYEWHGVSHVFPTSVPPGGKNEYSYLRIPGSYGAGDLVNKDLSIVSSRLVSSEKSSRNTRDVCSFGDRLRLIKKALSASCAGATRRDLGIPPLQPTATSPAPDPRLVSPPPCLESAARGKRGVCSCRGEVRGRKARARKPNKNLFGYRAPQAAAHGAHMIHFEPTADGFRLVFQ